MMLKYLDETKLHTKVVTGRKYHYYICDTENEEDTIKGEELNLLWDICFKYCKYFSLTFCDALETINYYSEIKKYAITIVQSNYWPGTGRFGAGLKPYVAILPCNERTRELLNSISDNLRDFVNCWGINNPEDPSFYREDGTVFFSSTVHECIFDISIDPNEDVSDLLSKRKWVSREHIDYDDLVWIK